MLDNITDSLHHFTLFKEEPILEESLRQGHEMAASVLREAHSDLDPTYDKWDHLRVRHIKRVDKETRLLKLLDDAHKHLRHAMAHANMKEAKVKKHIARGHVKIVDLGHLPEKMKVKNKKLQGEGIAKCAGLARPLDVVLKEGEDEIRELEDATKANIRAILQHDGDSVSKEAADKVIHHLEDGVRHIKRYQKREITTKWLLTDPKTKMKKANACKDDVWDQIRVNTKRANKVKEEIAEEKDILEMNKKLLPRVVKQKEKLEHAIDVVEQHQDVVTKLKRRDEQYLRNDMKQLKLIQVLQQEYEKNADDMDVRVDEDMQALQSRIEHRNETPGELCITGDGHRIYDERQCVAHGCVMTNGDCAVLKPPPKAMTGDEIDQLDRVRSVRRKCVKLSQRRALYQYAMGHAEDLADSIDLTHADATVKAINDKEITCWSQEYAPHLKKLMEIQQRELAELKGQVYGQDVEKQSNAEDELHEKLDAARSDSRDYVIKMSDALADVQMQSNPEQNPQIPLGKEIVDLEMKAFRVLQAATSNEVLMNDAETTPTQVEDALLWHAKSKAKLQELASRADHCHTVDESGSGIWHYIRSLFWSSSEQVEPCTSLTSTAKELASRADVLQDDLEPYLRMSAKRMEPATNKIIVDSMDANSLEPRVRRTQGKIAWAKIAVENAKNALDEDNTKEASMFFVIVPPQPDVRKMHFL